MGQAILDTIKAVILRHIFTRIKFLTLLLLLLLLLLLSYFAKKSCAFFISCVGKFRCFWQLCSWGHIDSKSCWQFLSSGFSLLQHRIQEQQHPQLHCICPTKHRTLRVLKFWRSTMHMVVILSVQLILSFTAVLRTNVSAGFLVATICKIGEPTGSKIWCCSCTWCVFVLMESLYTLLGS